MATKLYFRETDTGLSAFPASGTATTKSAVITKLGTGTSDAKRRNMTTDISTSTIGDSASASMQALASNQRYMLARFYSDPLEVTTIDSNNWVVMTRNSEGNAAANAFNMFSIYVVTSSNTVRGYIYDSASAVGTEFGTSYSNQSINLGGAEVTGVQSTDRICIECWINATPSMAIAYGAGANFATNVEATTGNSAAGTYLSTPQTLFNPKVNIDDTAGVLDNASPLIVGTDTAYDDEIDTDGPVAHWKLGEASGSWAFDRTGRNSAIYTGTHTKGRTSALDFNNGSDTAVRLNAGGSVNAPSTADLTLNGSWTVEMWVRPNSIPASGTFPSLISMNDAHTAGQGWNIWYDPSQSRRIFYLQDNVTTSLPSTFAVPAAGTRAHLVLTYDGSTMRSYVDGVEQGTGVSATLGTTSIVGSLTIGKSSDSSTNGDVDFDEVAIYNTALSGTRVLAHYNKGTTASGTNFNANPADTLSLADSAAGERGLNTAPADNASVADATALGVGESIADSANVADARSFDFTDTLADSANVADATSLGVGEGLADSISVADSAAAQAGKEALVNDNAGVADAQVFDYGEGIADTATVADATALGHGEGLADTATVADALSSLGYGPGLADTATVADNTSTQSGKEAQVNDNAGVADAQAFGYGPGIADNAGVADAQALGHGEGLADTAPVADAQSFGYGPGVNDAASVADAQSFGYGEGIADTAIVADDATTQTSGGTTINEPSLSVTDSLATQRDVVQPISDPATVADALRFDYGEGLADAVSVADTLTPAAGWILATPDAVSVADAVTTAAAFAQPLADNASVADSVATARGVAQALADNAGVADAVSLARDITQAVNDAASLADAQSFGYGSGLADTLVVADLTALSQGWDLTLTDAAGITDNVVVLGAGIAGAYIHHQPPLDADHDYEGSGVLLAVVGDGTVTVYDASGMVVTVDAAGTIIDLSMQAEAGSSVSAGNVASAVDSGVGV